MSAVQGAREALVKALKKVSPHVSILKLGGLAKQLESVLKCPIEGIPLSESDSTFQFLLQETCHWLEQQNAGLDAERNQRKIVSDVKGCLQRWLRDGSSSPLPQPHGRNSHSETASPHQFSSLPSTLQASSSQTQHLKKEAKGTVEDDQRKESKDTSATKSVLKTLAKLQGAIVRVRADDVLVKPIATEAGAGKDRKGEVTISKRNLNIGEFNVRLNAGDVVSFKISERNQKFGYAADLVRLVF